MQKKIMLTLLMSSMACVALAQDAEQPVAAEQTTVEPIVAEQAAPEQATVAPVQEPISTQQPETPTQDETPAVEPPVEEKPVAVQPEEEIEIKGLDTVDVAEPKGNWLYKRIWWEKAERVYEKIKQLTSEIIESRMIYFSKRHELDHNVLDPFYLNLGLEQGILEEVVTSLMNQLEREKAEGPLDEKEQELLNTINVEKKRLEELKQGALQVTKLDYAIEDALIKLMEQLNQARAYEQQAWDNFKAINRELSDKKARELYYGMDTYWKNLNSINTYLSDPFAKYFEQLTSKMEQETSKIKTTIQSLKEKGIDIKMQAERLRNTCKVPAKEEQTEQEEETTGLLGTLWKWVKAPFVFVGNIISGTFGWIGSWFGGSSGEENTEAQASEATQGSIDVDQEIEEDQE